MSAVLEVRTVDADGWAAPPQGRFAMLFGARDTDGAPQVRAVYRTGDTARMRVMAAPRGEVPTLVQGVPAASWDEREAADLWGLRFAGHVPCRPLVHHPQHRSEWATPVVGEDVHRIPVGPIHAGVIESGHFLFGAVGERVLHLDVRLFHKHRGLQRAAEGRDPEGAMAVLGRACGACAVSNAVAIAGALEQAEGRMPDEALRRHRTLLVELERMWNHLNDTGQVCAGVGLAPGAMVFAALKERTQRACAALTGHRFMFGAVTLGASPGPVDDATRARLRAELADVAAEAAAAARGLLFDASLRDRSAGTGRIDADEADSLGAVGPAARASGLALDSRRHAPRLWYPGFAPVLPAEPVGDVAARLEARWVETAQSAAIIDALLADPIPPGRAVPAHDPAPHGVGVVESPRGETVCAVEVREGLVRRVHLRTGSYACWPSVAVAATRALVPDFPLVNKSFELCYACVDR